MRLFDLGAKPVFVDIRADTLNLDENRIEEAITPKTKAIIPVHYAGIGCEMDRIMAIANKHNLLVIEDAAQGVGAYYNEAGTRIALDISVPIVSMKPKIIFVGKGGHSASTNPE